MMKEVVHGIGIGLLCVVITVTVGSFIGQAFSGGHDDGASAQPAAEAPAESGQKAE